MLLKGTITIWCLISMYSLSPRQRCHSVDLSYTLDMEPLQLMPDASVSRYLQWKTCPSRAAAIGQPGLNWGRPPPTPLWARQYPPSSAALAGCRRPRVQTLLGPRSRWKLMSWPRESQPVCPRNDSSDRNFPSCC